MTADPKMAEKHIALVLRRITALAILPEDFNYRVEVVDDIVTERMLLTLRASIAAYVPETEVLRIPTTPWQHLKDSYSPRWFRRMFPVQYRVYRPEALLPGLSSCLNAARRERVEGFPLVWTQFSRDVLHPDDKAQMSDG